LSVVRQDYKGSFNENFLLVLSSTIGVYHNIIILDNFAIVWKRLFAQELGAGGAFALF